MTPLPPISKAIQFKLFYNDQGNANVINELWLTYSSTLAQSDLVILCNNIMTSWGAQFAAQVMPSCSLIGVTGNDMSSNIAPQAGSTHAAIPGSNAGQNIPNGSCGVISYETNLKYKGGHGRVYVPGLPRNALSDGNTWTATARAAIQAAWAAFITEITTVAVPAAVGALTHVIAHRYGKTAAAPVGVSVSSVKSVPLTSPFTTPVNSYFMNPQVASQRRRNQQSG